VGRSAGSVQLLLGHVVIVAEVGVAEIGVEQNGVAQVGVEQVGTAQVGTPPTPDAKYHDAPRCRSFCDNAASGRRPGRVKTYACTVR
jgi:hypothetical protein